jgi:DENN (AEX-3) domain
MVSKVPLPTPSKDRVLFSIESRLLSVEVPPRETLPHADVELSTLPYFSYFSHFIELCKYLCASFCVVQISFQPLVQCLDVDNLIQLFTAVLLERRILLRSNK